VADVVVIGGGVMGASAAFWLTRMAPGLKVAVIEPDPTYARAATALSVASIRSQFSSAVNVKMSRFGIEFLRNFAEWTGPAGGVPDLGLRENGYLFVTTRPEAAAVMHDLAGMQRGLGAATEVLDRDALAARFGWLNCADLVAGSFGPRDEGWFDNMGLLWGLRRAAVAQGAEVRRDRAVAIRTTGGRVAGVDLASGDRIAAGHVVLAAGTAVNALLSGVGLSVPVEPRKRTVFVIDAPNARHPDAPLLIDAGFYLRPEGLQWITATVPEDDHACDINDFEPELQLFEEVIWEQLWHRAPGFDAVKVVRHWVGHYDFNILDQNAILGPHPGLAGLQLMTGFSGHGLQQAAAAGRGIAEQILHGAWQSIDLADLSIARVLAGQPLRERAVV
jgi:glycine/D-amino acid oxidase-like deaminating enzyme